MIILCVSFCFYLHWIGSDLKEKPVPYLLILVTFANSFMYVMGFLAGITIARSTALENLKDAKKIRSYSTANSDAVPSINDPLLVI